MASAENVDGHEEEEDFYLSDIHVEQPDETKSCLRIEIIMPIENPTSSKRLEVDSDGDFDRPDANQPKVLRIEHSMQTELSQVGLQLWRASLFLTDYVLNNLDLVRNKIVVDLGTGLGLTSFLTAEYSRLVFATDLRSIIKRARTNWLANKNVLNGNIRFKRLNWGEHESFLTGKQTKTG